MRAALLVPPSVLCVGCGLLLGTGEPLDREDRDAGTASFDGGRADGSSTASDGDVPGSDASSTDGPVAALDGGRDDDAATTTVDAGPMACSDDGHEPDGTLAEAMSYPPIYAPGGGPVTYDQVACPGDADMIYAYSDCCEFQVGAVLRWDPSLGDLSLSIVDQDGALWSAPVTLGAGYIEILEYPRDGSRYFYVRVHNFSASPISYTLDVYAGVYI